MYNTSQKDRRRIHNLKPFLVCAPRKGGQGPVLRCWLEQTVNPLGGLELSQAGTLRGAGVILGM